MAIDTSMYQNYRGADVAGSIAEGIRLGSLLKDMKDKTKLKEAASKALTVGPDGRVQIGNLQALASENPQAALQLQQAFDQSALAQKEQQMKTQEWQRKQQEENLKFISRAAGVVKDQNSYQMTLNEARARGIDVSALPSTWGEEAQRAMNFYSGMALSELDKLNMNKTKAEIGKIEAETAKLRTDARTPNRGQAPTGYRFRPDGSLEAIPGGPAAIQQKESLEKKEKMKEVVGGQAMLVTEEISRALDLVNNNKLAAGPYAGKTAFIPGTPAQQLRDLIQSIKSNVAFDKLQAMREASPTGGALGAVSDREMALLQASAGELRPDMNEKDLAYNLQRIQNKYTDILKKLGYIEDDKGSPKTKVVNGVTYKKVPGGWEAVD